MESYGEVTVPDFIQLMRDYLEGRIDAIRYRETWFRLFTKRVDVQDQRVDEVLQEAYGDADDYDATVRLPYTIEEPELKQRVMRSLSRLAELGY